MSVAAMQHKWIVTEQSDVTSGCQSSVAQCADAPKPPPTPPPPGPPTPFVPTKAENMNGEYILSPTPNGNDPQHKFPTHFKDYPRGVEYFDVYSPPIKSLYSQVFWTGLPAVPLPADIVSRYHGKGMAVVGFGSSRGMHVSFDCARVTRCSCAYTDTFAFMYTTVKPVPALRLSILIG